MHKCEVNLICEVAVTDFTGKAVHAVRHNIDLFTVQLTYTHIKDNNAKAAVIGPVLGLFSNWYSLCTCELSPRKDYV